MCDMSSKPGLFSNPTAVLGVCCAYRLDVEGLVHRLHWVTVAELWGRRAGGAIIQHQGPEESVISHMCVTIQRNNMNND